MSLWVWDSFFFFLKSYACILFFPEKKQKKTKKTCKTKIKCCCMKLSYICSTTRLLQAASHKMPPVLCTIWDNLAPVVLLSPSGGADPQIAVPLWSTLPKLPTTTTFRPNSQRKYLQLRNCPDEYRQTRKQKTNQQGAISKPCNSALSTKTI